MTNEDVVERLTVAAKGAGPKDFTPQVHFTLLLEARDEIDRLREALGSIVSSHEAYCEKHVGVSAHSHELSDMAEAALTALRETP